MAAATTDIYRNFVLLAFVDRKWFMGRPALLPPQPEWSSSLRPP